MHLSMHISIHMPTHMPTRMPINTSIHKSVHMSVHSRGRHRSAAKGPYAIFPATAAPNLKTLTTAAAKERLRASVGGWTVC